MEAHAQWASRPSDQRFETLTALRESVHGRRLRSRSVDVDCEPMRVFTEGTGDAGKLLINGTISPCEPTHWSFGQLSTLVKAPASYLRTLPKPMVVDLLNHGLQNSGRETVKFMTVAEEDGATLQAVTSPKYGRIWDADVVDSVSRLVEKSGGRFTNPRAYAHRGQANGFSTIDTSRQVPSGLYASDRDVFIFMVDGGSLLDAGPRAQLNRGFIAWNSETGARTFGLMTFLFNVVCGNHIIWGAEDVNKLVIRHTGGGPARFDSEAAPLLLSYANATAKPIEDTVRKATQLIVGNKPEEVTEWLNRHGKFSRSEIASAIDFAKSEEGEARTLWQLVQGFTAYARGFDYIDSRVDLETRAGKLLQVVSVE